MMDLILQTVYFLYSQLLFISFIFFIIQIPLIILKITLTFFINNFKKIECQNLNCQEWSQERNLFGNFSGNTHKKSNDFLSINNKKLKKK